MVSDNLFTGFAVVIDDDVNKEGCEIADVIQQIEQRKIPVVKYDHLPADDSIEHFHRLSFLVLDWILYEGEFNTTEGVRIPGEIRKSRIKDNLDFITRLQEHCFTPLFIFTSQNVDDVKKELADGGLLDEDKHSWIFVCNKHELVDGKLFERIEEWLKLVPSVYVLKEWEREYSLAKNKLFWDFFAMSPSWAQILVRESQKDSVNASKSLGEIILKNLQSRMRPFSFDEAFLLEEGTRKPETSEMLRVIEGERFLPEERLHKGDVCPGDIYRKNSKYYLNVRPECDCVGRDGSEVEVYLLRGSKLSEAKIKERWDKDRGKFFDRDNSIVIFPLHNGRAIEFNFKDLKVVSVKEIEDARVGRLLPPYIVAVQQRYSAYLQRQGLLRIPFETVGISS